MTEFIAHRINTIEELVNIPNHCGVELDLRDYGSDIIIQHDPFKVGQNFEEYLKNYNHGTLILNVKSEQIEFRVLDLIKKYEVKEYFFLDCSFPMIYQLSSIGENNLAVRFSEFEGIDTILNLKERVKWVWVDCFTKLPITRGVYDKLIENKFKLCLVSPELQGQGNKIEEYKGYLKENDIVFDAICTKFYNINKWEL